MFIIETPKILENTDKYSLTYETPKIPGARAETPMPPRRRWAGPVCYY